jgi:hypothetical protein
VTLTLCTKKYIYLYLVLYVCFVGRCLSFCTFSFGHCAVCSSSIYGFWLPLWYFQNRLWSELFNGNSEWFLIYVKWVIVLHMLYSKDEFEKKELNEASFQSVQKDKQRPTKHTYKTKYRYIYFFVHNVNVTICYNNIKV